MILLKKIKKIDWLFYKHLGIFGLLGIFWMPEFKLFFLFYLIYLIDPLLKIKKQKAVGKQDDVDLSKYYLGVVLSTFNPFFLWPNINFF